MKVFLKTLKSDLDHDPSNGSLSKFNQVFLPSLYIIPASFMQIRSVVFARSCSQTHRQTDRQTDTRRRKHNISVGDIINWRINKTVSLNIVNRVGVREQKEEHHA